MKSKSLLQKILPEPSSFPQWSYDTRSFFRFELIHKSSKSMARVGRLHTPHGVIDTPSYVPVATNAALKGVDFRLLDAGGGSQLVFSNTYHLLLHPGREIIRDAGGIHKFTNRDSPFITDSGGFQVFSLAYGSVQIERNQDLSELKRGKTLNKPFWHNDSQHPVQITEDGVHFTSYRDNSQMLLTPESTVDAQKVSSYETNEHSFSRICIFNDMSIPHKFASFRGVSATIT